MLKVSLWVPLKVLRICFPVDSSEDFSLVHMKVPLPVLLEPPLSVGSSLPVPQPVRSRFVNRKSSQRRLSLSLLERKCHIRRLS